MAPFRKFLEDLMKTDDLAVAAPRPLRADARRNYERLLTAAGAAFAELGPEAPLEEIARRAGVGIGTLYRHFPTRQALLVAVYQESIEAICAEGEQLLAAPDPGDALNAWLRAILTYNISQRGLKEALMSEESADLVSACKVRMREVGADLLARAQQAGAVRSDMEIGDLLRLVHSIALASEQTAGGTERAERLLSLMLDGLRRQGATVP